MMQGRHDRVNGADEGNWAVDAFVKTGEVFHLGRRGQ